MMSLSRTARYVLLFALVPRPGAAQENTDRSHRWYWGAQAGGFVYQTNAQGFVVDPMFGAHWLITGKRTALYIGGEEAFFLTDSRATVFDPNSATGLRDAIFSRVRRLFFGVLAYPTQKRVEPYVGGGFAIMTVQDPTVDCSGTSNNSQCPTLNDQVAAQNVVDDAASKAFGWIMAGFQMNTGKLAFYGQYMLTSAAAGFLISGTTHTIQGGVRYSLGGAKEDVSTAH